MKDVHRLWIVTKLGLVLMFSGGPCYNCYGFTTMSPSVSGRSAHNTSYRSNFSRGRTKNLNVAELSPINSNTNDIVSLDDQTLSSISQKGTIALISNVDPGIVVNSRCTNGRLLDCKDLSSNRSNQKHNNPVRTYSIRNIFKHLKNIFQALFTRKNLKSFMVSIAIAMTFFFLSCSPSFAVPSGGRMGGSVASPSRSSPAPSSSSSSYSRGYSKGSSYRKGYGSSYPRIPSTPYYSVSPHLFSPFSSKYSYGGGGAGVITCTRRVPSFVYYVFTSAVMFQFTRALRRTNRHHPSRTVSSLLNTDMQISSALGPGTSVVRITVAMNVPNRDDRNSILSVLNRLSETARMDNRVGIQNLSSEVSLELLRQRARIVSASSYYKHFNTRDKAQQEFNSISVKERAKFEHETISKFNGVDYGINDSGQSASTAGAEGWNDKATMAVVTMVLSIDGDSTKVPTQFTSIQDVQDALQKISSDSKVSDCLQSVEILWTPLDRKDTLGPEDLIVDYPDLRTI